MSSLFDLFILEKWKLFPKASSFLCRESETGLETYVIWPRQTPSYSYSKAKIGKLCAKPNVVAEMRLSLYSFQYSVFMLTRIKLVFLIYHCAKYIRFLPYGWRGNNLKRYIEYSSRIKTISSFQGQWKHCRGKIFDLCGSSGEQCLPFSRVLFGNGSPVVVKLVPEVYTIFTSLDGLMSYCIPLAISLAFILHRFSPGKSVAWKIAAFSLWNFHPWDSSVHQILCWPFHWMSWPHWKCVWMWTWWTWMLPLFPEGFDS